MGKPSQYDDLDRFVAEQDLLRRLAGESPLPLPEARTDIAGVVGRIAGWLEETGGLYAGGY